MSVEAGVEAIKIMKTLLLAVCLLGASAAFGQGSFGASALSNEASPFVMPSHPLQAYRTHLSHGQDIREETEVSSAQGERPLWEVAPKHVETPLGDIARDLKKQHEAVKKSDVIWVN